jgi:pimeloyl-ACP methyl ester carboxylesterase
LSRDEQKNFVNSARPTRVNPDGQVSVEEHWIGLGSASDGSRMRYLQAGSGPALLLVHGLLGYSFSWRFALPALAQQSTVYAVDMLGAGFSDRPANLDCSFKAAANRLRCFMDKVGLNTCNLLGTSHGGAVAMMTAELAPERFPRLILVDPVNPWSAHGKRLSIMLSNPAVSPLFLGLAPRMSILHEIYHRRMFGDPRRVPPDSLEGYRKPMRIPGSFEYALGILRTWNRDLQELESMLPRIAHIPSLLIWGSLDTAVDPASASRLKKHFKNCRLIMMEGVGHLPYEETPDEFNRITMEFLSADLH